MTMTSQKEAKLSDHPNAKLVRDGLEAFNRRDLPSVIELFSEDVVWHFWGRSPLAGDYKGRDAAFQMVARLQEIVGGTLRYDVHDVLGNDQHVAALTTGHSESASTDKELHIKEILLYNVDDGKITEVWTFSEDQRVNDEFWSAHVSKPSKA